MVPYSSFGFEAKVLSKNIAKNSGTTTKVGTHTGWFP